MILAFIGHLADQIAKCRTCKVGGPLDPNPPEQWAWWALSQNPRTRQVVAALVPGGQAKLEHTAGRVKQLRTPRPLPMRPRVYRDRTA